MEIGAVNHRRLLISATRSFAGSDTSGYRYPWYHTTALPFKRAAQDSLTGQSVVPVSDVFHIFILAY